MTRSTSRLQLAFRLARARTRGRPHTLSHLVTGRCNGRCLTCLWRDPDAPELDTASVTWLYGQAGHASFAQLVVWGGEPLLRQDLPELLLAARRARLHTTLISNGWLLAERWAELRGLLDVLILSLDDTGEAHDRLRGLPGLFDRLQTAAGELRTDPQRPGLLINTVLSRLNRGALARVAPLARAWGAGLYFCPMETGDLRADGFVARRADLALDAAGLRAAAAQAGALKRAGYPILNTRPYLDLLARDPELRGYTCRMPRSLLTVGPDGAIRDCLRTDQPLATIRQLRAASRPLTTVLNLPRYRELRTQATACTKCNNPDVVELSWLWDLRPAMLHKVVQLARL